MTQRLDYFDTLDQCFETAVLPDPTHAFTVVSSGYSTPVIGCSAGGPTFRQRDRQARFNSCPATTATATRGRTPAAHPCRVGRYGVNCGCLPACLESGLCPATPAKCP